MTQSISAQLEHVLDQLLPLIQRMRNIDWALTPPERNSEVPILHALVTAANQKLHLVPMAETGREVAQRMVDALLEGVARWNNGDRADAALASAQVSHDDAVKLLRRT